MNTIAYGGVAFPCSRAGVEPPASRFAATDWIKTCNLATLVTIGRPADEEVRRQWMRRFVADMHWLPLIEVLSGCHPRTDPAAHAAFMKQLAAPDALRIAHHPSGPLDRHYWGSQLRLGLKARVPNPTLWAAVRAEGINKRLTKPYVLFIGDDCAAAAEAARPECLKEPRWLFYKAIAVIKRRLDPDDHRTMMLASYSDDPSSTAYWDFVKQGQL